MRSASTWGPWRGPAGAGIADEAGAGRPRREEIGTDAPTGDEEAAVP